MNKQQKTLPNTLFEMGYEAYKADNYDKAINYFNQAVESGLNDAASFVEIGVCVINITGGRNLHLGERYFMRAIELEPTYAMAYFNLGVAHMKAEEFEQAISYFDKSIEYHMPNIAFAYYNRASAILYKTANERRRRSVFDRIVKYELPHEMQLFLVSAYNDILKAIQLGALNNDFFFVAGQICYALGREQEARGYYIIAAQMGDQAAMQVLHEMNTNTNS